MHAPLAALLLLASPIAVGDFRLAVPEGFQPDAELGAGETAALAIAAEGDPERRLLAIYRAAGPESATLTLSEIEAPLALDATSKATLAAAVASHFKRNLELPFDLQRTVFVPGVEPRVEVWGTLAVEGHPREVGVAFFAGAHKHAVAVASLPAAGADALRPLIQTSWQSLTPSEAPEPLARRRTAISIAVWGLAAVILLVVRLRRRRKTPA